MERRCIWTSRISHRVVRVSVPTRDRFALRREERTFWVLPEHADDVRRFMASWARRGPLFLAAAAVLSAIALAGAFSGGARIVGSAVAGIGLLVVAFPFVTPEAVEFLGMRRAIAIARAVGAVTVALGALLVGSA